MKTMGGGVCHTSGLAIYITKIYILRQKKKNYGNSNIFTMQKKYKSSQKKILLKRNQNPSKIS
jgi:hypothetical protein